MITSYESFFYGSTWNFHAIILLLDKYVKFNSILDYIFDKNVPFGLEKKVSGRLWILPKWEHSALTQLCRATVSNNTIRGFSSTLVLWKIFNKLTGFMLQISNVMNAGAVDNDHFLDCTRIYQFWILKDPVLQNIHPNLGKIDQISNVKKGAGNNYGQSLLPWISPSNWKSYIVSD